MTLSRTLLTAIASLAVASAAPLSAQDPHAHDATGQPSQPAAPGNCPMGAGGMGSQAMEGAGAAPMQHGMMMGGQQMQRMTHTMQQMRTEMQAMREEMMQMRQEMHRRRR